MVLYLWKWSCGAWRINPTSGILKDPRCTTMQWCIVAKLASCLYKRRAEVMYAGCFDSSCWIQQRRSWGQCSGFLSTKRTKLGRHRTECKNQAKIESNKRSKHDNFLFVSIVALLLLYMNQWIRHAFTFQVCAMPFFAFHFCNFLFAISLFCFFSVKPCSVPHKTRVVIGVAAKEPLPLPPSFRNQNLQWPISYDCGFWSEHHLSSWISGNSIYDIIVVILIQRTISHIKINTTTTTFIYHTISHYILNHHIPHYTYSIY